MGGTTSKTATKVTFWIILPPFLQPLRGKGLGNALELYDNFCPPNTVPTLDKAESEDSQIAPRHANFVISK